MGAWMERLEGWVESWRKVVSGRAEVRVVRRGKRVCLVDRCMVAGCQDMRRWLGFEMVST